jgi:hypothetical protein
MPEPVCLGRQIVKLRGVGDELRLPSAIPPTVQLIPFKSR